tara:strand:+ start:497 stop:994 length:498 start_codon:yes stop_codon:yes gene_type:complete
MQSKAVFFDRDNTLIIDSDYMHKIEDFKLYPDTISALKTIQSKNYKIFIITNQSGVGRGYFSIDKMHAFNDHMLNEFKKHNIEISDLVFCPHAPDDCCDCRKPQPKLINELIHKYNIDKSNSFMVGDKLSDAQTGLNAGVTGILLNKKSDNFKTFTSLTELANFL